MRKNYVWKILKSKHGGRRLSMPKEGKLFVLIHLLRFMSFYNFFHFHFQTVLWKNEKFTLNGKKSSNQPIVISLVKTFC